MQIFQIRAIEPLFDGGDEDYWLRVARKNGVKHMLAFGMWNAAGKTKEEIEEHCARPWPAYFYISDEDLKALHSTCTKKLIEIKGT